MIKAILIKKPLSMNPYMTVLHINWAITYRTTELLQNTNENQKDEIMTNYEILAETEKETLINW